MKDSNGYEMTESHSEKDIYTGCVMLMQEVSDKFIEYIEEYLEIDLSDMGDEAPVFEWTPTEIVEKLFLWKTSHSGMTSRCLKCKELGIDTDDDVVLGYEEGYGL